MAENIFSNLSLSRKKIEEENQEEDYLPIQDTSNLFSNLKPTTEQQSEPTLDRRTSIGDTGPSRVDKAPSNLFSNLRPPRTEALTTSPLTTKKYSQTDLYANPEFQRIAERFMESIGADEDVFEYMRDADWRLGSTLVRAAQIGNWDDQQKSDYVYLRNAFNNTDLTGAREWLQAIKDIGIDLVTDPGNWLAVAFAAPSLGGSTAVKATAHTAAVLALKQMTKKQLSKATVKELTKNLPKGLKNQVTLDAAKSAGKFEMVHGGAWLGLHDYFMQTSNLGLGVHHSDRIDWKQAGLSTAAGAVLGGTLGGLIGGYSARKYLIREFNATNEEAILKEALKVQRAAKGEAKPPPQLKENQKLGIRGLDRWISNTVGKVTTRFKGVWEGSPKMQEYLAKIRTDFDSTTFGQGVKQLRDTAFGQSLNAWQAKLLTKVDVATNNLYRESSWWKFATDRKNAKFNHLNAEENNQLWHLIVNPRRKKVDGKDITPEVRESARQIRTVLKEIFDEGTKHKVWQDWQRLDNYLPRKWQYAIVEKDRGRLEKILIDHGLADPLTQREIDKAVTATGKEIEVVLIGAKQKDEEVFGTEAAKKWLTLYEQGNLKEAQKEKASHIVNSMLDSRFTPFELRVKDKGGHGFLNHRPFAVIPDEVIKDFLETDVEKLVKDYVTNAASLIKRAEFFGKNKSDFTKKWLDPIKEELKSHVVRKQGKVVLDTDGKPTPLLSTDEINLIIKDLEKVHNVVTGVGVEVIKNKTVRTAVESAKLIQQMAHLPLATISSITEPMIMLNRVGWEDGPVVAKEVFRALGKETARSFDRTTRAIQRGAGKKVKGRGKDLEDAEWLELYESGLALESSVMDLIEGMHGTNFQNVGTRAMQNFFFKSNLLTQWTSAVQLASFTIGKRLIKRNTEKLYKHAKGIKTLSKSKKNLLERELIELDVNPNEARAWYNKYSKNGEFNATGERGAHTDNFYKDKIAAGANKFTNEIILNPSGMQGNKPLWFSNPHVNFLVQFLGYPTVFNNTVLKRFINESWRHPVRVAPKVAATSMLMTATALATNYIRTVGIQGNEKWYNEQSEAAHLWDAWSRWGGAGWADFGVRYTESKQRGAGGYSALLRIGGPLTQDIGEAIQYNRGYLEPLVKNLPYSAWLPTEFKRNMYKQVRDFEEKIEVIEGEPYKQSSKKEDFGYRSSTRKRKKKKRI